MSAVRFSFRSHLRFFLVLYWLLLSSGCNHGGYPERWLGSLGSDKLTMPAALDEPFPVETVRSKWKRAKNLKNKQPNIESWQGSLPTPLSSERIIARAVELEAEAKLK